MAVQAYGDHDVAIGDPSPPDGSPGMPYQGDWAISRRSFLVGAGVTVALTSGLGPWIKRASANASPSPLPDGFVTGLSGSFDQIAGQGGETALATFSEVVATNAVSIRFPVAWDRVESRQGRLDWSQYDPVFQSAVFDGLRIHPVLIGCPDWVGDTQRKQAANGSYYPTGSIALNAFGQFAVDTLRHFGRFGDGIDAVEVWNEPNNPAGAYIADPREFSRMLSTVGLFVDCANSDEVFGVGGEQTMTVLSGGLYAPAGDASWESYLGAFAAQLFPYQVGLHVPISPARGTKNAEGYAAQAARSIASTVDQASAMSDRDIWVTGTGASAQPPWGEAGQAQALTAIVGALVQRPDCRAMMVSGMGSNAAPSKGSLDTLPPASALLRPDGTPTPALAALTTAWASR